MSDSNRIIRILHWFGFAMFFAMGLLGLATAFYTLVFVIEWPLILSNKELAAKLLGIYLVMILVGIGALYVLWKYRPGK